MASEQALGEFGGDNRAGVPQTLHRISAIRNRKGKIVGLTCRVGRAVLGHVDMFRDILEEEGASPFPASAMLLLWTLLCPHPMSVILTISLSSDSSLAII